ncbi:MAG TPA: DUF2892 domain-containing protein [Gammaproteobacteria bacterium]|nr:DUF2892 domain-containing protein [Gammaproteobacteria bacterium]
MLCNLSVIGQVLRVIVGTALIFMAWYGPQTDLLSFEWIKLWNLGWLGLIPLISGIAAFCPIYAVLGCGHSHKKPEKK